MLCLALVPMTDPRGQEHADPADRASVRAQRLVDRALPSKCPSVLRARAWTLSAGRV